MFFLYNFFISVSVHRHSSLGHHRKSSNWMKNFHIPKLNFDGVLETETRKTLQCQWCEHKYMDRTGLYRHELRMHPKKRPPVKGMDRSKLLVNRLKIPGNSLLNVQPCHRGQNRWNCLFYVPVHQG